MRMTLWPSISHWHLSRHILLTLWGFICYWQRDLPYGSVGVHIWHFEKPYLADSLPPYLIDILSLLISLTVCTSLYPLMSWLAHWLYDSVNAVNYPTLDTIFPLTASTLSVPHAVSCLLNIGSLLQSCTADLPRSNTLMCGSILLHTFCV